MYLLVLFAVGCLVAGVLFVVLGDAWVLVGGLLFLFCCSVCMFELWLGLCFRWFAVGWCDTLYLVVLLGLLCLR